MTPDDNMKYFPYLVVNLASKSITSSFSKKQIAIKFAFFLSGGSTFWLISAEKKIISHRQNDFASHCQNQMADRYVRRHLYVSILIN